MKHRLSVKLHQTQWLAVVLSSMFVITVEAADSTHQHGSPYAGEETRQIKSLSSSDIKALQNGAGWGLAKAAELNGVPGPLHLLEMKEVIALTAEQTEAIETIFSSMNKEATRLGNLLVEKETELDTLFKSGVPKATELKALLHSIGDTRSELRFTHLKAHLQTPALLTTEQLEKYNHVRGYASNDPCQTVPERHDPDMWKKHNNCG